MTARKPSTTASRQDNGKGDNVVPLRKQRPCPICGRPSAHRWHPFCSKRCADVDLHRWLSGSYAIPAAEDESAETDSHSDNDAT